MDGATTWNASSALPPCAAGSVSGPMISMNSTTEPGQPCVTSSGRASGSGERWWMKWTSTSPICVLNWSNAFRRASCARQSYSSRQ